ncbi:hypothetical protein RRG08_063507, partial [Elysia crispata]
MTLPNRIIPETSAQQNYHLRLCPTELYPRLCPTTDLYLRLCPTDLYPRLCPTDLYLRLCRFRNCTRETASQRKQLETQAPQINKKPNRETKALKKGQHVCENCYSQICNPNCGRDVPVQRPLNGELAWMAVLMASRETSVTM